MDSKKEMECLHSFPSDSTFHCYTVVQAPSFREIPNGPRLLRDIFLYLFSLSLSLAPLLS